jgi:hypothetical protein
MRSSVQYVRASSADAASELESVASPPATPGLSLRAGEAPLPTGWAAVKSRHTRKVFRLASVHDRGRSRAAVPNARGSSAADGLPCTVAPAA